MLNKNTAAIKKVNGVWLNGKHSYRDYGMFLSERPKIEEPEPRLILIDIPGADGELDATEAASGSVVRYKNRTLTFVFAIDIEPAHQQAFKSRLLNDLHGGTVDVELDEDAGWVYSGRAKVSFDNPKSWEMKVTVSVDAYPYKKSKQNTELVFDVNESGTPQETASLPDAAITEEDPENTETTIFYYSYPNFDFSSYDKINIHFSSPVNNSNYSIAGVYLTDTNGSTLSFVPSAQNITVFSIYIDLYQSFDYSKVEIVRIVQTRSSGAISFVTFGVYLEQAQPQEIVVHNNKMSTIPSFYLDGVSSIIVKAGDQVAQIDTETHRNDDIVLQNHDNIIELIDPVMYPSSRHTITVVFQEGML